MLEDYVVPSFDGISALEITCTLHPDVPFIFVSGSSGGELAIANAQKPNGNNCC
ncbi:response regulator [Scytonema sp. NUACC21]